MAEGDDQIEGQSVKRLNGRTKAVGNYSTMPIWAMGLFGMLFVGVGGWITLMSVGLLPMDQSKVYAPMWVLTVVGLAFFSAGLMIWVTTMNGVIREQRRQKSALLHPSEPAMADYPWNQKGCSPERWKPLAAGVSGAIFMTVFLSVFNWWAFWSDDGALFVKIIVSVFDVILIFVWVKAFKNTIHVVKFGKTRLEYVQFPYRPGDWFQAKVELPSGLEQVERALLSFRCIREYYVVSGQGKNRRKHLVVEQLWSEEQELTGAEIGPWPRALNATFQIPARAPGTCIHAEKPVYWELAMEMSVPGVDLKQEYLVPVYA